MIATSDPNHGRLIRFVLSVGVLGLIVFALVAMQKSEGESPFIPVTVFLCYIGLTAAVITAMSGRLYAEHGLRRFRFDVANLLLLTVLTAMPFAAASGFWRLISATSNERLMDARLIIQGTITIAMFFLFVPILCVAEAVMTWSVLLRRRKRPRR